MSNTQGEPDVRSRRKRIELTLRYQVLFLEAIGFYVKPVDEVSWRDRVSEVRGQPFSSNALGLGLLHRALILDQLRALQSEVQSQDDAAGTAPREDFIDHAIETIVAEVEQGVAGRPPSTSWTMAFQEQVAAIGLALVARLEEFTPGNRRHLVVSDVHLGVSAGNVRALERVMEVCEHGDELILLGDILDFWIHLERDKDLEEAVVAEWLWLYRQIRILRKSGVMVHYVPGNHDLFVFLLEAHGHLDWCGAVLKRCPPLQKLHHELSDFRLASVCEIRYPFLKLTTDGPSALYTHGHVQELDWQFLTGNPYEDGVFITFLQTTATALAYRFARELRGAFNLSQGPINWVRHATDIACVITNEHLQHYANTHRRLDSLEQRGAFIDSLVAEFQRILSPNNRIEVARIEAARAYDKLELWQRKPVSDVRAATLDFIEKRRWELNFHLWSPALSQVAMSTTRLKDYQAFDNFVCGHYHQPRDQAPDFDNGCLLQPGPTTCVLVTPQGRVVRPAGIF